MAYNTGNPLGSTDPRDLIDNAGNLDEAVNSESETWTDRRGVERATLPALIAAYPNAAADAALAESARASAEGAAVQADDAADRAELAADAAFVNADVYPDVTTGLAAVADGDQFQVVEGDEVIRYRRDSATVATEVARLRNYSGFLGDIVYIGAKELVESEVLSGTSRYVFNQPLPLGDIKNLEINAAAAGRLKIFLVSIPSGPTIGNSFSLVSSVLHVDVSEGYNSIDYLQLQVTQNNTYLGYQAETASITVVNSSVAPTPFVILPNSESGTVSGSQDTTLINLKAAILPLVEKTSRLSHDLGELDEALFNKTLDLQWGTQGDLVDATVNPDRQWVFEKTFDATQEILEVTLYARSSGSIEISTWSRDGTLYTKEERVTVAFGAGQNTITLPAPLVVEAGQRIGFWGTAGALTYNDAVLSQDFVGYRFGLGGKVESFTSTSNGAPFAFQVRFGLREPLESGALGALSNQAQQLAAGLQAQIDAIQEAGSQWEPTTGYILVWAVGQSNMAGRAVDPSQYVIPAGRGYRFEDSDDSLQHLVDPTTPGGGTSPAAGIARAVLDSTKGRIGVILINTAVGGTSLLSAWAAGGGSWTRSKLLFDTTLSLINSNKLNVVGFAGVMVQGETDADNSVSAANYKTALQDLISRMKTHAGTNEMPFVISQTGVRDAGPEFVAPYAAIRQAQADLAASGDLLMAHSGAKYFLGRGLMMDQFHYTAPAYDEIGVAIGHTIVNSGLGLRPSGLAE